MYTNHKMKIISKQTCKRANNNRPSLHDNVDRVAVSTFMNNNRLITHLLYLLAVVTLSVDKQLTNQDLFANRMNEYFTREKYSTRQRQFMIVYEIFQY